LCTKEGKSVEEVSERMHVCLSVIWTFMVLCIGKISIGSIYN